MSKSTTLTPDDISESQFRKALAQYPDLIKAVSDSKGSMWTPGRICPQSVVLLALTAA